MTRYQIMLTVLAAQIGLPVEAHMPQRLLHDKTVEEAQGYKEKVWCFFTTEPAGYFNFAGPHCKGASMAIAA